MGQRSAQPQAIAAWPGRAVLLRPGEGRALLAAGAYFFFLLCSYYILRPVRDEMGVRAGVDDLQWLFTATFLVMLLATPAFAALVARYPRHRLVPAVYAFFIACMIGFWFWLRADLAMGWAAGSFFVWLSVFSLFVVSVFWSVMADLFDDEQAARLFGAVAAGGSLGAIVGPGLTAALVGVLGPAGLLPLAALLLALTLPCLWGLERWSRHRGRDRARAPRGERPLGGGVWEGVRAVVGSRYLLGICGFIWLYTSLSTVLYFAQAELVAGAFADTATRTAVFAGVDLATNLLTVAIQLFLTGRIVQHFGLSRALAAVPLLLAGGLLVLAAAPLLWPVLGLQVVRRAGNYALTKPGREMLFSVVPRVDKYKAKNFIDTVVYRGGDAVAGWAYAGLSALGLGLTGLALAAVPLALLWGLLGYRLGGARSARAARA